MNSEEKKKVYFSVYNTETDDYEQLEMDADDYEAMCQEEDRVHKEYEIRRAELDKIEREDAYYGALREEAHEKREYEEYMKRIEQDKD